MKPVPWICTFSSHIPNLVTDTPYHWSELSWYHCHCATGLRRKWLVEGRTGPCDYCAAACELEPQSEPWCSRGGSVSGVHTSDDRVSSPTDCVSSCSEMMMVWPCRILGSINTCKHYNLTQNNKRHAQAAQAKVF